MGSTGSQRAGSKRGRKLVWLINLGSPSAPTALALAPYLSKFLGNRRVLDIWTPLRLVLGYVIIPLVRSAASAKLYRNIWLEDGAPLVLTGESMATKLQTSLNSAGNAGNASNTGVAGDEWHVRSVMSLGDPNLSDELERAQTENYSEIIALPLYPQYASSSTGVVVETIMQSMARWHVIPAFRYIAQYHDHPDFIEAVASEFKPFDLKQYDKVLFSYHGLPESQVDAVYKGGLCAEHNCDEGQDEHSEYCYKASCYTTTRLLADKLDLTEDQYLVGFQSRLGKGWLEPFSDVIADDCARQGQSLLVCAPSFTVDCLETIEELGIRMRESYAGISGKKFDVVPCVNDSDIWIKALRQLIL